MPRKMGVAGSRAKRNTMSETIAATSEVGAVDAPLTEAEALDDTRDDKLAFALARGEKSHLAMCEFAGYFVTHTFEAYRLIERKQNDDKFAARVIAWRERIARDNSILASLAEQRDELTREWALENMRRVVRMAMGDDPITQTIVLPRARGTTGPIKVEYVKVRKTDLRVAYQATAVVAEMLGLLDGEGDELPDAVQGALADYERALMKATPGGARN